MNATNHSAWVGWRAVYILLLSAAPAVFGASVLFPEPLHLTRRIQDPIADRTTTVEEYCSGNAVVTVRGRSVAIADYEKGTLTEIDHAANTFSIVRFDELARRTQSAVRSESKPSLKIEVDRTVALSREALDVLVGAAYPNAHQWQHDAIAEAARVARQRMQASTNAADAQPEFNLPKEQTLTWEEGGRKVVFRNEIVAIDKETVPPELLLIPRGAQQVEHSSVTARRLLDELEGGKAKE